MVQIAAKIELPLMDHLVGYRGDEEFFVVDVGCKCDLADVLVRFTDAEAVEAPEPPDDYFTRIR